MWKAKAYKVLPKIIEVYPQHRWLFVTLTVRNCPITELKSQLQAMNKAFQRMVQRKTWPAEGWLRSTEVTRGRDGSAHPHFHCLLMVSSVYFSGKGYMKQGDWVKLWRDCLRVDYDPVMDVRAVKRDSQPMDLVPELLKYCTKESDLTADREWFLELTRQMHKARVIATGGVLKEYLKELEQEPEDLIGEGQDIDAVDEGSLWFGWEKRDKIYRMV
jgi:plasmid rolling circle replication initiator protein Rep